MLDFASFYKKYSVDIKKLKRDYEKQPLRKILTDIYNKKTGKLNSRRKTIEKPYKEDIEYLYIELNIPLNDILNYFNLKRFTFSKFRSFYGIKKTYKKQYENVKKYYNENYGVDGPSSLEDVKNKIKKTNLNKYGTECVLKNQKIREKAKQTCLKHYGVKNPQQSEIIKNKTKITYKERYGVENVCFSIPIKDKIKKTNLKKYGVENVSNNELIKEKKKQTCLKHHGVENPMFSKDIVNKIFEKRKRNGTVISSSVEEKIYSLLNDKFSEVKRQYKSVFYPFACDFYISDIDLYIEIQGHQSHGKEPYDKDNKKHQEILKGWQEKVKEFKMKNKRTQYESYIKIWTISDPKKRNVAK